MSFIVVIDAILVMLAMLLFLWTWAKSKSKKSKAQSDGSSSNTQKISAIGKTVLGALWKIVYWVIIAGLIAAAALVAYCFLFPSVETIYFTPNQLSGITIDLEEPGVYEIKVSGSYEQCFLRKSGKAWKRVRYPVSPNGIAPRRNWPSAECRRHLPLPSRPFGMVIAKIGEEGKFIPIGYGRKIKVNGPTTVHSNINVPPDWIDVPGKTPADNFIHNTGVLRITVERDRTIFEKIAEVLLSFKQYFKGDS